MREEDGDCQEDVDDVEDDEASDGITEHLRAALTIKVHPDLLRKALRAHAKMPPDDRRDLTAQMIMIIKIVEKQRRVKDRDRPVLNHAIHLRLEALNRLHDRPEMRGYSFEKVEDGCSYVHDDLVVAASTAPLVQRDEFTIEFDINAFFKLLLRDGRHDGTA